MKKTLFISDLHLQESEPAITQAFLALLDEPHHHTDALYILGDFFEAWVGDDHRSEFNTLIISALKQATDRGLTIYLMHGNRDFLIGKRFLRATGCQLIADETLVNLYGTDVLLLHGDTLCTADKAYQRSRMIMRNRPLLSIYALLPLHWRLAHANKLRQASSKHTRVLTPAMMDVTQTAVEKVMRKYNVSCMIHGHTHKPDTHTFTLDGKPATRIVLPMWHGGGAVMEWYEDGTRVTRDLS